MIPIVEFKTDLVTDVKQSKELAEILPVLSADCCYNLISVPGKDMYMLSLSSADCECTIPAWSAGRLINIIKDNVKKFELSNVNDNYKLRIYFSRVYKDILDNKSLINVLISAIKYFKNCKIKIKIRDYEENTIPFDLSKIDKDTRIETKGGYEVEILKTDMRGEYPIIGIVKRPNQVLDLIGNWTINGNYDKDAIDMSFDLVIVKECFSWWDTHSKDRFEQFLINGYNKPEGHYITLCNVRDPSTPELAFQQYAFTKISHILKNDFSYGGMITNVEWNNSNIDKFCIIAYGNDIRIGVYQTHRHFLAFHSEEAAKRFIEEYPELVKQYLGIEDDIIL